MATTHAGGPGVLMAAWMILEMELAAQDATDRFLPEGYTTVGYEICVRHRRPTPVGETPATRAALREGTVRRTIVRQGTLG
jgi:predicted thioesterase